MAPSVLILRAPGTNCDAETAFAFERAGGVCEVLHLNRVLENPRRLAEFQILCLPGGFSYGDDLAAGRIFGSQIDQQLGDVLHDFKAAGKLILGVCNGFQVLMRAGDLLIDVDATAGPSATLTWNESGRFEDRWVTLQSTGGNSVFLTGIQSMYLPVAHAEGKFVPRDEATLGKLADAGQLVLKYTRPAGQSGDPAYPENPNGATAAVAGISDSTGRVLGLMPHPERHIDRTHHPRWTRGEGQENGEGLKVFENAVRYFS